MRSVALIAATILVSLALSGAALGDDDQKAPVHKVTQSKSYMMIDPLYATIIDDDRPVGLLMVAVGIDVPDSSLRSQADHVMPVLRDAYMRSLMAFTATAVRPSEQPDVVEIANRLQRVTDKTLGHKGARVLLAQVAMRITK
jgi:hypothetical protein